MLDHGRVAIQPDKKREQLFTDRYERLLACALRLTNHLRDAEDLVHDAFVQWVLGRTRLEEIENIDGYLRRMLRYMHISRISRSAQHLHETALSVADYDSFRLGWTAIDAPRRMQASEELHQICAYACSRKESSRAGSVLILRFFHDYFPLEIAGILNSSRDCVDQWQRLARREVKLSMNKPGRLRFVSANAATERHPVRYLVSECDLMLDLRRMIFSSCQGDCLSQFEMQEAYSGGHAETLTTRKLAHIVSCAKCLDAVNRLLGLPLLAERYHPAPGVPKDPPHDKTGGGISGGESVDLTKRLAHKLREIHEHKPHELRIAVNGFLVSSVKVTAESSELNLNLTPDEPAEFVEVCSEQGLQLLFFSVNPGGSQSEQWACIELSEGRSLEACFRNENGPSLHVIYKDSAPLEAHISNEILNQNFLSSPLSVVSDSRKGFYVEIWKIIGRLTRSLDGQIREASVLTAFGQSHYVRRKHAWWGLLTGLIAAAVVAGFLFFKASLEPAMTATVLLERASIAERVRNEVPDRVRHRLINLEERRNTGGTIVDQQTIEIWEDRASGNRSQRLYDNSKRMIAGVWQTANGSRTVYHHGSKPQSQPLLASPDNLLLNLEDIWQLEPSAHGFGSLIPGRDGTDVEERPTTYVLRYEKERTIGASRLLKASLTLNKSDLHPLEQTLLVQRGGELHEYRFVEVSFELVPVKTVAPTVFEIEPELTGETQETARPRDGELRNVSPSRVPPSLSTSAPPVASAELEVDVAYLLNQVKADRNEQVALTRSAGGSLRVEGVVDSRQRKDEFIRALGLVSNNPAVKIDLRTIEEARPRAVNGGIVSVEAVATNNTVAADEELRRYFSRSNPGGSTDEAVRSYSSRMVNRAYRALFHAIELKRLVDRFTKVDMHTVAPDARAKWVAMLREHASSFASENAVLRREIEPVFFPETSSNVAEEDSIRSDADLTRAVERLHKLALANNDAIRSAFTISAQSSAVALKSAAFWQSIQRAENLAEKIRQYQTTSK